MDSFVLNFDRADHQTVNLSNALYERNIRVSHTVALQYGRQWTTLVGEFGGAASVDLQLVQVRGYSSLRVIITGPTQGVYSAFDRAGASGHFPKPTRTTINVHGGNNQFGDHNRQVAAAEKTE